jgi:hypothetical protein
MAWLRVGNRHINPDQLAYVEAGRDEQGLVTEAKVYLSGVQGTELAYGGVPQTTTYAFKLKGDEARAFLQAVETFGR